MTGNYDLANSFVIGDRTTDIQLAANLGCRAIFLGTEERWKSFATPADEAYCTLKAGSWIDIAEYLVRRERTARVVRTTRETDIEVEVALFGEGRSAISTGIGFFDHLLDQLARHSGADLTIRTRGDLQVDEHHTVEDTALALGQAFRQAWGDLRGMNRYGFVLPMDESRCSFSIDLGGRPYLVWNAEFHREKVGELPTELFRHFFHSFADGARCTLHIDIQGDNEHHKIESAFKALARTLRQAWEGTGEGELPTTKGKI